MNILSCDKIVQTSREAESVVIVGSGIWGQNMLFVLKENNIEVSSFFDNDNQKKGKFLDDIEIIKPQKLEKKCLYIICIKNFEYAKEVYFQLISLGILSESIIIKKCIDRNYEYIKNLDVGESQEKLDEIYFDIFGKFINWESPKTYNEKINWEKFNIYDTQRTRLADKHLVRDWVREKIGEEYLTTIYKTWDNVEDIEFSSLPSQFVLKLNNGSGRNIIVTDKKEIDKEKVRQQLNEWKQKNFYYGSFERQYKDIIPKIICEEYLEGVAESLYDYDVFCFHGEPKYIWCINGSHRKGCKASFYDLDWNKQDFSYGYPIDEELAPKPKNLENMLELSRVLSKDFTHARIDWYEYPNSKNGILFSEITFSTWSGLKRFEPKEYDRIFGDMI